MQLHSPQFGEHLWKRRVLKKIRMDLKRIQITFQNTVEEEQNETLKFCVFLKILENKF